MDLMAFRNPFAAELPVYVREHKVAHIQRFHGRNLVFGMEWYLIRGQDDKAGIRKACRESAGDFGMLLQEHSEIEPGSGIPECVFGIPANVRRLSRAVAAAGVVAQVYATAIVVVPLDQDHYWLLALSNGVPVIGKDLVLGIAKTKQITHELLMAFPAFELVGDAAFWKETKPGAHFREENLYTLLSSERTARALPLVRYDRQWQGAGVSVVAIVMLLGFAIHYVDGITGFSQHHLTASNQQEHQQRWDDQVLRENTLVVTEYNQIAANYPIGQWIQRLVMTADMLQLEARGWRLKSLSCESQLPHCNASWINQGVGTFKGLVDSVGQVGEMQFISPLEVTQSVTIPPADAIAFDEVSVTDAINMMPDPTHFHINHVSVLQAISSIPAIEAGLNQSTLRTIGKQHHIPPTVLQRIHPVGVFTVGGWHLSGQGLRVLMGSLQKLDAQVFFGKSLLLEFNRDNTGEYSVRWRIEGDYVVKP